MFQAADPKIREVVPDPVYTGMSIMTRVKPKFEDETFVLVVFGKQLRVM